jgi:hypothetical protein
MHAVAEQGVPAEIAEAIGRAFKLPVASIAADDVQDHFGWVGAYFAMAAGRPGQTRRWWA